MIFIGWWLYGGWRDINYSSGWSSKADLNKRVRLFGYDF